MNKDIENQPALLQKMIKEQDELNNKINKYVDFINEKKFDDLNMKQKHLLKKQLNIMQEYFDVLDERINLEALI